MKNLACFAIAFASIVVTTACGDVTGARRHDAGQDGQCLIAYVAPSGPGLDTGEVWASMLWESYASLLRAPSRLTFAQAQDRMIRYLVAAYKMLPCLTMQ